MKASFNDWLTTNPGKRITIYEISQLSSQAYYRAFTSSNIKSGFSKPGIWPFSRLAFNDDDFIASHVTSIIPCIPTPGTSSNVTIEKNLNSCNDDLNNSNISSKMPTDECPTPECVRPFPKAQFSNSKNQKRKKGRSRILTDSPEKDRIARAAYEM